MQEREWIRSLTAEVLQVDEEQIRDKTRFIEDLGADSLELFTILTRVEETCRVSFPTSALNEVVTVGDAIQLLVEAEHKG